MAEDSTSSSDESTSEPSVASSNEELAESVEEASDNLSDDSVMHPSSLHYCASTKAALFIGIAVTYKSVAIGLAKHRILRPAMHTFRQVNDELNRDGRPSLPEELTLMVEDCLRKEGQVVGEEGVSWRDSVRITESTGPRKRSTVKHEESSKPCFAQHLNTDMFTLADLQEADKEYMLEVFSLNIQFATEPRGNREFQRKHLNYVYLCIPWHLRGHYGDSLGASSMIDNDLDHYASVEAPAITFYEQRPQSCLIDQDLTVTREKTLLINRAIRELGLEVVTNHRMPRQTDAQIMTGWKDFKFESTMSPNLGTLWQPRVILLLGCSQLLDFY